jgi:hypothetical protein
MNFRINTTKVVIALVGCLSFLFSSASTTLAGYDSSKSAVAFPPDLEKSRWPVVSFSYIPSTDVYSKLVDLQSAIWQFPICTTITQQDCIENLETQSTDGQWIKGEFNGYVPVTWGGPCRWYETTTVILPVGCGKWTIATKEIDYQGNTARNYDDAARDTLWTFPSISTNFQFLLSSGLEGDLYGEKNTLGNTPKESKGDRIVWSKFTTSLIPVLVTQGTETYRGSLPAENGYVQEGINCYPQGTKPALCFNFTDYASSDRFRVTIRMKTSLDVFKYQNWMSSRATNAEYNFGSGLDAASRRLVLSGDFAKIRTGIFEFNRDEESFKKYNCVMDASFDNQFEGKVDFEKCATNQVNQMMFDQWKNTGALETNGDSSYALLLWSGFEKIAPARILRTNNSWIFRTSTVSKKQVEFAKCSTTDAAKSNFVVGNSFSNASVFSPEPPKWDAVNQSLDFKLAGVHQDENGTVISGFYGLNILESVAKCLWNVNPSAAKVVVSVVTSDGTTQVSTTSSGFLRGFLNFRVSGFHYSVNVIKVKLIDSNKLNKAVAKKVTITCVKGKVTKKVTAASPKCPVGYKKK